MNQPTLQELMITLNTLAKAGVTTVVIPESNKQQFNEVVMPLVNNMYVSANSADAKISLDPKVFGKLHGIEFRTE
jgi:hypothetical protein